MRIKIPTIIIAISTMGCADVSGDAVPSLTKGASGAFHQNVTHQTDAPTQRNERVYRPSVEDATPNLYFALESNDEEAASIQLRFIKRAGVIGPRAMELFVAYPEGFTFVDVDSLPATAEAEKKIIVQQKEQNILRVIIYSAQNVNRIGSGGLATLHFQKEQGHDGAILFASEGHVFAPVEANRGLLFGDELRVGW